jgi:hypothetical protein
MIIQKLNIINEQKYNMLIDNISYTLSDSTYLIAQTIIPQMIKQNNLIYINGYINNKLLKVIIDTGASISIIPELILKNLKLDLFIDSSRKSQLIGMCTDISIGKLWYVDLVLDNNNFPLNLTVIKNQIKDYDIILGINFLKEYQAIIDFNNNIIKLNNHHNISFRYDD